MPLSIKSRFLYIANKVGDSKATALAAALAVIAAAFFGYFATQLSSESVACDIRRERALAEGPLYLRYGREEQLQSYQAPVYLELARLATDPNLRRQNAYLATLAINESIILGSRGQEDELELWSYPTEKQLSSPAFFAATFDRIEKHDQQQLIRRIQSHDDNFGAELGDHEVCDRDQSFSNLFNFLALILSALSVSLIALREYKTNA